jgi:hypothetical protein
VVNAAPLDAAAMMAVFERVAPMIFGGLAVLVRIAVLFSVIPELGTGYAPRRVRLVLFASMATVVSFGLGLPALPVDTSVVQVFVTIMREVLLGAALGLDLTMLREVFSQTGANSQVLKTDGEDMQNRDHSCFFSGAHAAKDSTIAWVLGAETGLPMPLAAATKLQFDRMNALGLGALDKSGVAELTFKSRHA